MGCQLSRVFLNVQMDVMICRVIKLLCLAYNLRSRGLAFGEGLDLDFLSYLRYLGRPFCDFLLGLLYCIGGMARIMVCGHIDLSE